MIKTMQTCYVDMETRAIADLVRPGELHRGWTITRINVPRESRGKGLARFLLQQILDDADEIGAELWLDVSASDGLDSEQLTAWYLRHGFKRVNWYGTMCRPPQVLTSPGKPDSV